jgi:hypothetical protein
MNNIVKKLEAISDGEECLIAFSDGEILRVKDCEGVNESTYNRSDLVIAHFVALVKGNRPQRKPGSAIQFSVDDVVAINGENIINLN